MRCPVSIPDAGGTCVALLIPTQYGISVRGGEAVCASYKCKALVL